MKTRKPVVLPGGLWPGRGRQLCGMLENTLVHSFLFPPLGIIEGELTNMVIEKCRELDEARLATTNRVTSILYGSWDIWRTIGHLAAKISADYVNRGLVMVIIMKGALPFGAKLQEAISLTDCEYDFMVVSSYGDKQESSGKTNIVTDLAIDVRGRPVLVLDDVIDTAGQMSDVVAHIEKKCPSDIKICALVNKTANRTRKLEPDYFGFKLEVDDFLVGCGLDDKEKLRNLPFIGALKKD